MLNRTRRQRGFSLLEVLITMVIAAFALLGLAALEYRSTLSQDEAIQRALAESLLNGLVDRIETNSALAHDFSLDSPIGSGVTMSVDCAAPADRYERDICEVNDQLRGKSTVRGSANVGGALSAKACVTELRAADATIGVCLPGIYTVTVVWQGLVATSVPTAQCGVGSYGSNDAFRRAISARVIVPLPACS